MVLDEKKRQKKTDQKGSQTQEGNRQQKKGNFWKGEFGCYCRPACPSMSA
jgi:hypothetical protein